MQKYYEAKEESFQVTLSGFSLYMWYTEFKCMLEKQLYFVIFYATFIADSKTSKNKSYWCQTYKI